MNPVIDLPRALNMSMGIAIASFLSVNLAFFASMPFTTIRQEAAVTVVSWKIENT